MLNGKECGVLVLVQFEKTPKRWERGRPRPSKRAKARFGFRRRSGVRASPSLRTGTSALWSDELFGLSASYHLLFTDS
jgi:hypothetical protein